MKNLPVVNLDVECDRCVQVSECGGLTGLDRYEGCFVACRQRGCRGGLGWTCPCRPAEYIHRMRSVGGMGTFLPPKLLPATADLPLFIPTIHHASRREGTLNFPVVAIPLRFVLPLLRKNGDINSLRKAFGLGEGVVPILLGVSRDFVLEDYWANRSEFDWPTRLVQLGFQTATSPNYSFFRDAPEPDIIYNRRRILITSGELSSAGISTILHLNALTTFDWKYWSYLLSQQTGIVYVAKEFQTGLHCCDEGKKAIYELARLQDQVGRELRPVIIGGTQYLEIIARYFKTPTFIESSSFMRTVNRQRAIHVESKSRIRWQQALTTKEEPLDDLLSHNVEITNQCIHERWQNAPTTLPSDIRTKRSHVRRVVRSSPVSSSQMAFRF